MEIAESAQTQLADEDIMPTGDMTRYEQLNKIRLMSTDAEYKAEKLKDEIKMIKDEALYPFKNQIDLKKASVELWTTIALFFQISAAKEEAKIKSLLEDPTFYVYAYSIAGDKKGVQVKVGTGQDMMDTKVQMQAPFDMQIIAGFWKGTELKEEFLNGCESQEH